MKFQRIKNFINRLEEWTSTSKTTLHRDILLDVLHGFQIRYDFLSYEM